MESDQSGFLDVENISDSKLGKLIGRCQRTIEQYGRKLPDRGKKIRATIKRLEAEKDRRKLGEQIGRFQRIMGKYGRNLPGGSPTATMESDQSGFLDVENMSDSKLGELIGRFQRIMEICGHNLADRGKKIEATIKRLEAERERRKLRRVDKDASECVNSSLFTSLAVAVADTMESDQSGFMDVENMSDSKLGELIGRFQRIMENCGRNLPDRGKKIRATIKRLEAEKERRKLRRVDKDANECVSSRLSKSGCSCGRQGINSRLLLIRC